MGWCQMVNSKIWLQRIYDDPHFFGLDPFCLDSDGMDDPHTYHACMFHEFPFKGNGMLECHQESGASFGCVGPPNQWFSHVSRRSCRSQSMMRAILGPTGQGDGQIQGKSSHVGTCKGHVRPMWHDINKESTKKHPKESQTTKHRCALLCFLQGHSLGAHSFPSNGSEHGYYK